MLAALASSVALCAAAFARVGPQDADRLWEAGRRVEAVDSLAEKVERDPSDRDARKKLVDWEMQIHRYARALEHVQALGAEASAIEGEARYRLADYAGALALLPATDLDRALMRIDALEALGRAEESDRELDLARERFPTPDARLLAFQGRRLLREARAAESVVVFRAALERDPFNTEALYGVGRALLKAGDRDAALAAMRRHRELTPAIDQREFARQSLDLAPRHAPNWTALGDAERALGRTREALLAYENAARLATGDDVVPNALRHARLFQEDLRDVAGAIDVLKSAAERAPNARLYVRMGDLASTDGRLDAAVEHYERALALRPDDAEIRARLTDARRAAETARGDTKRPDGGLPTR